MLRGEREPFVGKLLAQYQYYVDQQVLVIIGLAEIVCGGARKPGTWNEVFRTIQAESHCVMTLP